MLRWFLSLHSPKHPYTIAPSKLPKAPDEEETQATDKEPEPNQAVSNADMEVEATQTDDPKAGASSVLPASQSIGPIPRTPRKKASESDEEEDEILIPTLPEPPTPFTPSINKVLNMDDKSGSMSKLPPLPEGMTVAKLKSRLDSKNKVK